MKNQYTKHNRQENHNKPRDYEPRGLQVNVINNDIAKAMRKFKKKVTDDGILQELRKKEYFESKGTKRRLAKKAAIRRARKNHLKEHQPKFY